MRERERFSLECLFTQTPSNPNSTKSILFLRGSKALVAAGLLLRLYFARLSHFHRSHRPPLPPLCLATLDFFFGDSNRKLEARASLLWSTDEGVMVVRFSVALILCLLRLSAKYMAEMCSQYRDATEDQLEHLKQNQFAGWLSKYVAHCLDCGPHIDDWLREFVYGPDYVAKSYPRYCSRGYSFAAQKEGSSRRTNDFGVSSSSGDDVYYGNICEILEIRFPGMIGLRCTVFYCDWYNYTLDRGVTIDAFGVRSVHSQRQLQYYDPFILASQADQVCYIRYPRVRQRDDPWITVTSINPRGRVEGVSEPLQPNSSSHVYPTEDLAAMYILLVDLTGFGEDVVHSESEAEIGEDGNDSDSCSSDPSSDSEFLKPFLCTTLAQLVYFLENVNYTLTLEQLNNLVLEAVPKKKGRYVGIGRSINDGSSSSVHCLYPVEDLMEQIKNKDEEIAFLKTDNAEIRAELQVNKSLTETIMDKLKNRFGEDF
ncbi:hypothetical protein F2Q68_00002953 [Brassica cretica]|uniref:DUF4216 domain-containing protein n=1 Tax=Brassica cretica TaxID=69181 RepID=A0A8S9JI05_BRACR|nr:hypothetical protein F2Q68_00002953 [Brassica cretica]